MGKWQPYLNGTKPYVVLNNVLYETGVGRIQHSWLQGPDVITNVPTKRIGIVPKSLAGKLPNKGFKVNRISFPI